jgi:transcriptional regulator with XRE-family HTH domain
MGRSLQRHGSVRYTTSMAKGDDVSHRIAENIKARMEAGNLKRNKVAEDSGHEPPWLTNILAGKRKIQINDLDKLASALGVPVGELVAPPGTTKQLNAYEAALLRWYRRLPESVRMALLVVLGAFANEPPSERTARHLYEFVRHANPRDRDIVWGFVLEKQYKGIPQELEQALVATLSDDAKAALENPTKRRRKTP